MCAPRPADHFGGAAKLTALSLIAERALSVITGEVGVGKTVAIRAALAGLDQARHTVIYLLGLAVMSQNSKPPESAS